MGSAVKKCGCSMEDCCSDVRGCLEDCNGSGCGLYICWRNGIMNDTSFDLMPSPSFLMLMSYNVYMYVYMQMYMYV